ncbi:MAG TPA: electron transport complex subunit RsxC [Treponemataceae bacterium]|nr:electron transport complex subunit RsxC [Treponemataceae bacterium]
MKTLFFKGGIYPPENKKLSNKMSIQAAFPSTKTVIIPLTQGGAPNKPIVAVGSRIVRGQKIAESHDLVSAPVHASISGVVKKIENRLIATNKDELCIIIESDGSNDTDFMAPLDPFKISNEEAIKRIKEAGIVGMGGASFPTHVKLSIPANKKVDLILVNAAECEPYLTIDERSILEKTDAIIDGLVIAIHVTKAKAGAIVLENNKKYLVPTLEDAITKAKHSKEIGIMVVETKYPQGSEKSLVFTATGQEIPAKGLPVDVGCVVQNVGTLISLSEAFRQGKPLIDRPLTISGGAVAKPKNLVVPIGTAMGDLIPEVIELKDSVAKIICGGPMMGCNMIHANFSIAKNTSGVLFLTAKEICLQQETPCINCGKCIEVCPYGLYPVLLVNSVKAKATENALKFGLLDCVECGSCEYVCPAHVKLVQKIRDGKIQYNNKCAADKAKSAQKEGK